MGPLSSLYWGEGGGTILPYIYILRQPESSPCPAPLDPFAPLPRPFTPRPFPFHSVTVTFHPGAEYREGTGDQPPSEPFLGKYDLFDFPVSQCLFPVAEKQKVNFSQVYLHTVYLYSRFPVLLAAGPRLKGKVA